MSLAQKIQFADSLDTVVQLLADVFREGGSPDLAYGIETALRKFALEEEEAPKCGDCDEDLCCPVCLNPSDTEKIPNVGG